MTAPSTLRIRFIPKPLGKRWGVYDVLVGSYPRERPGIGQIAQDHPTEAAAQVEADRLIAYYKEPTK